MARTVLDASALLALLNREPGAEAVRAAIPEAVMSSVNLAETASTLADVGMPGETVISILNALGIETQPFDDEQAFLAAFLRPVTRSLGLSLGDRACLALAQLRKFPVMTADKAWAGLDLDIELRLIR